MRVAKQLVETQAMLTRGTDALVAWPTSRWDTGAYYDPDPARAVAAGKSWSRHGGLVEDEVICGFDHAFFGIPEEEDRGSK